MQSDRKAPIFVALCKFYARGERGRPGTALSSGASASKISPDAYELNTLDHLMDRILISHFSS
jgi:hypothetical protein